MIDYVFDFLVDDFVGNGDGLFWFVCVVYYYYFEFVVVCIVCCVDLFDCG